MYKLLSTLKRIEAENCIVLTYNLDLPFFESGLFEPLYGYGCRNTFVICDPRQYEIALDDAPLLRYAGQRYLVFPGETSAHGAFHPKLIMLTSKNKGHLYVLSGNLSRPGYTSNWEVLTEFAFDDRHPDPVAWRAFRWAFETIRKITALSDSSGLARERLDRLWGTTSWLRQETSPVENAQIWMLDNLSRSLLDQIESIYRQFDNHPIKKAVVISPYFDYEARAFEALLSRFQPKAVDVYTEASPGINPKALSRVLNGYPTKLTINQLVIPRRLHAKVLLLQTQETAWLASGSANFSAPALLHPAQQGNTELVALRYEPDAAYYKEWVDELIHDSTEIDWKAIPERQKTVPQITLKSQLKLEAARLHGLQLELLLLPVPVSGSKIAVNLNVGEAFTKEYQIHNVSKDGWLAVTLPKEVSEKLQAPTLISIFNVINGKTVESNRLLLHNIPALERYSKPPNRANRPRIPAGLTPESDADYAWLLDMIHDLLITNQDQLKRHGPHIVAPRKEENEVEEVDGDYKPEEHIVDEPVRQVSGNAGADELYADYEKRWTYQEILNAVLTATYSHKLIENENNQVESSKNDPDKSKKLQTKPPTSNSGNEEHLRIKNRISNGFKRLVENFQQGLSDEEYLKTIPPNYLLELWLIITRYLQVVWKNDLLDKGTFHDLSLGMLFSFWGKPAQPGAWRIVKDRFLPDDLQIELQRLSLPLNIWLYAALLSNLLEADKDAGRFDLYGWMRMFIANVSSPDSLRAIGEEAYRLAWHHCFPNHITFISLSKLIETLNNVSQQYDDSSLQDEVQDKTGYAPTIEYGEIANLRKTPKLILRMPLTDSILDQCLKIFQLFLTKPTEKSFAWVRFENIDPVTSDDDIRSVTIFFRSDTKTLLFAAERLKNQSYSPEYDLSNITLETLRRIRTLSDLDNLQ